MFEIHDFMLCPTHFGAGIDRRTYTDKVYIKALYWLTFNVWINSTAFKGYNLSYLLKANLPGWLDDVFLVCVYFILFYFLFKQMKILLFTMQGNTKQILRVLMFFFPFPLKKLVRWECDKLHQVYKRVIWPLSWLESWLTKQIVI